MPRRGILRITWLLSKLFPRLTKGYDAVPARGDFRKQRH
jgi:hypothetical protein